MAARGEAGLRQLRSAQEAQQRQAGLVRQRPGEVLKYGTQHQESEQQLEAIGGSLPGRWEATEDHRLKKALLHLEEEQQRCENLAEVNAVLQERLKTANEFISALKEDLRKLTVDWIRAQKELELKEGEWHNERKQYENYFRGKPSSLLSLWRQVLIFRHHFLEMKTATNRDLSELKAEQMRFFGFVLANCSHLNSDVQLWESITLSRRVLKAEAQQQAGQEISQKAQKLICLKAKEDMEKKELQDCNCAKLEKIREELQQQLEVMEQEVSRLHQSNTELQLKEDSAQREKLEQQEVIEKARCDRELLLKYLGALQGKHSLLQSELVAAREALEELHLQRDQLQQEKNELIVALEKVSQQQKSASNGLEELRQEFSHQAHTLAEVNREKELLVQEKAVLKVRLTATERDTQVLSGQLAEARSEKETLESSLFQAQQHLSQLEVTRVQLEIQLHEVTQAKEATDGELKCLQSELEAERSLMRQERENMAQQLLLTEQQCNNTLRLQQTNHEVEVNKLLQDLASKQEELLKAVEEWENEKAETKEEHEKKLLDMKQKVAAMQAQQEEERARVENARQEVLLEKEREKNVLLQTLLQSQAELREACQQLDQLRQEMKEQQENRQNITEMLQAELQESESKIKAVESSHKQEIKTIKEEMNSLLQQRHALQKQVEELTSQLAASEESLQMICRKAQQDLSEAQELSRQKTLEVVHLQKIVEEKISQQEEAEHQNKELQVCLQSLKEENSRWEEVEHHDIELQASLKLLESENARLTLSLEEKELKLRTLEENNLAQHKEEVSQFLATIEQAQQQHSDDRREIQELNKQIQSLQEEVLEKKAGLATREKKLLQDLEESRAGERCLKDSLRVLEDEMSNLHLRLCSAENRAKALATECERAESAQCKARSQLNKLQAVLQCVICDSRELVPWSSEQSRVWDQTISQAEDLPSELTVDGVAAALQDLHQHLKKTQQDLIDARKKIQDLELELSRSQAEKDHFSAQNQELQEQFAQIQKETKMAECKKNCLLVALQEESTALKEQVRTLQHEVASLEKKLKSPEKQRKDVQQAAAEGEQLSWLSEKRILVQQLECLQRCVARLEYEKMELKQFNAELRGTLEEVERERRRLKRYFRHQSLPDACGFSVSKPDQHKTPPSRHEESRACCRRSDELQNQMCAYLNPAPARQ